MKLPSFNNPQLLTTALTHRSALNEPVSSGTTSKTSYERLEFLGDAVLELIVTRYLFDRLPQKREGSLTYLRSALVRTETLAEVAQELELGKRLYISKGEEHSGGRTNFGLLADVFEAVVGALYLDQGLQETQSFVLSCLLPKLKIIRARKNFKDPKTTLQETVQAMGFAVPEYSLIKAEGPDHNVKFEIEVKVGGKVRGRGVGSSKQRAQQKAAEQALEFFVSDKN